MTEVLLIVALLLAAYGMADLAERMAYRLIFSGSVPIYCVIPLHSENDAEFFVRKAATERKRLPCQYEWLMVDCGLTEQERVLTKRLCEELRLSFCVRSDLDDLLSARLQKEEYMVK